MHQWHQRIERMWWQPQPPNMLWRMAALVYQRINQYNLAQRHQYVQRTTIPLISVGNITVGGSGKTPFVAWLVEQLQRHGMHPVILCRGDGGTTNKECILLTKSQQAKEVGDEALMLAQLTHCPVISGKNRVQGAMMAAEHGDIIVLDDGFQYRQLHRDCDIVLIPDTGIGNAHLIPAGPLREKPSSLERADIVIRSGQQPSLQSIPAISPHKEWLWHTHNPHLCDWMKCAQGKPTHVHAICAIARPERFLHSLQQASLTVDKHDFFPDHYTFSQQDIANFLVLDNTPVFTAKDAVKIKPYWPSNRPLWVLQQDAIAEAGLLQQILAYLKEPAHTDDTST